MHAPTFRLMLSLLAFVWMGGCANPKPSSVPLIAITQIATHPALDEVRAGLLDGLRRRGFEDGKTARIEFKNANGDPTLAVAIAEEFARQSPAVIVPISTPSALSAAKTTNTIPIVFSGVTDPVGTKLVADLEHPGGNITGVSDRWPFEAQVDAFMKAFPKVKRIGMLYTRGDDVSKIGVDAMNAICQRRALLLELSPVSQGADVYPTAVALLRRVDVVYTGIDHLVLENLDTLVKAAHEARKPLFGGESGSVEKGGVLALSINMAAFGDITADLVAEVLRGRKPRDLPIRVVSSGDLVVNRAVALQFGVDLKVFEGTAVKFVDER